MTDEDKDDAPMTDQECSENADDVINCMRKALEGAVGASKKPAWAIAGLMLAVDSLKAAMVEKGLVNGVDLAEVIRWTEGCIANDPGSGAAVALQEIGRRQRVASATPEELQAVIHAATACVALRTVNLEHNQNGGHVILLSAERGAYSARQPGWSGSPLEYAQPHPVRPNVGPRQQRPIWALQVAGFGHSSPTPQSPESGAPPAPCTPPVEPVVPPVDAAPPAAVAPPVDAAEPPAEAAPPVPVSPPLAASGGVESGATTSGSPSGGSPPVKSAPPHAAARRERSENAM